MANIEKEQVSDHYVQHRLTEAEIFRRLENLEEDVKELYKQLQDKADNNTIKELIEKSTKEIEELKKSVMRLDIADAKHTEALNGIRQLLESFKETQDELRKDYNKLAEYYRQSSVHIASITAILAERARKEEENQKKSGNGGSSDPWYVRLFNKSKALSYAIVALVTTIVILLITRFDDIITLLTNIFGK